MTCLAAQLAAAAAVVDLSSVDVQNLEKPRRKKKWKMVFHLPILPQSCMSHRESPRSFEELEELTIPNHSLQSASLRLVADLVRLPSAAGVGLTKMRRGSCTLSSLYSGNERVLKRKDAQGIRIW